ncbi:MAG: adenosylhomocysteinase, partial [Candidatus Thermoplasmatota archaeon]
IMDMSFSIQALCAQILAREGRQMEPRVHAVPREVDERVARLWLKSMGVAIDGLSAAQRKYLASWTEGT